MDDLSSESDGKVLATASAQLRIFDCSNNKKMQKFSGHPVSVVLSILVVFVSNWLSSLTCFLVEFDKVF